MKNKGKRSKKRLNIKLVVLSLFTVYFMFTVINQQTSLSSYNKHISSLESRIEKKGKELEGLSDASEVYSSDEYIEKAAREKLGLVRADETVFVDITGK